MKFFSILASLALATAALASPALPRGQRSYWPEHGTIATRTTAANASEFTATPIRFCLTSSQATTIVKAFNYLLANPTAANFNATALALFSSTWTDTSDSINQLIAPNGSLQGTVTFSNVTAFITSSTQQPPLTLTTLDIFSSCTKIAWRWVSVTGTSGPDGSELVKGIDVFEVNSKGQVSATYAEFNSGAWMLNLGLVTLA